MEITVTAGRVLIDPRTQDNRLFMDVQLKMTIDPEDGNDAEAAVRLLQAQAERLVERHRDNLPDGLRRRHQIKTTKDALNDTLDQGDTMVSEAKDLKKLLARLRHTETVFTDV